MKNSAKLLSHLSMFETNRLLRKDDLRHAATREEYAEIIADCFTPCAQAILAGHFRVVNKEEGKEIARVIYPTALELYYHEEGVGGFKDPIMYHTDDRKIAEHRKKKKPQEYFLIRGIKGLPYYPVGNENPHTSGIDITFENPFHRYRASFLIRKYEVVYESGVKLPVDNSTEIYDDMLLNGIPMNDADWVEWIDGDVAVKEIQRGWRQNVPAYDVSDPAPENWKKIEATGVNTFSSSGVRYKKCPFDWQFSKK